MSSGKLNRAPSYERFMALNILATTCELSGRVELPNYVIFIWRVIHACT